MGFHLYNQWRGLLSKDANWQDFTFIRLEIEKDNIIGVFTADFALLGFNFQWSFIWDRARYDRLMGMTDEILEEMEKGRKGYTFTNKEIH